MKVAIVHELLTMKGGAERVAKIFADMFPEAPVYTLLYDEKKLGDWFPKERVRTGFTQKFVYNQPLAWLAWILSTTVRNHHFYLKHFPRAVEAWDFSAFDLVISSSSAFTHGIITNGKPKHLCYVHSPARYLWDRTHDVVEEWSTGLLGPIRRRYLNRSFHTLRIWDSEAADRPDVLLAASKEVQHRIEHYWRRESDVVYPPIEDEWFEARSSQFPSSRSFAEAGPARSYFLVASTLARYKRIDLAIEAANALNVPLKIAGEGNNKKRLKKLAGSTIEFLGHQSMDALKNLYANAIALIIPGEEDFGLAPIESMACGTPVIAYRKGGVLETIDDTTGAFFDEPNAASLANVMKSFDRKRFNAQTLKDHAAKFSRIKFEEQIQQKIKSILDK